MQINLNGDLIVDEYGNYYIATILKNGSAKEVTLENAFMHYSFNRIIHEELLSEYRHQYLGKLLTEILKNAIESTKTSKVPLKIIPLKDVVEEFDKVTFYNVFEKNPNIDASSKYTVYEATEYTK